MWFLRCAQGQTDKQTDTLIAMLRTHNGGEIMTRTVLTIKQESINQSIKTIFKVA